MTAKTETKPMGLFALRVVLVFGLLIVPWPGWNQSYGSFFCYLGQSFFYQGSGSRLITVSPNREVEPGLDSRMTLANRSKMDRTGRSKILHTDLATRSVGWIPTALTAALILATPIPWSRRILALVCGLVLVHLFILFTLQTWIWSNSAGVSLIVLSSFWQRVADELKYAFLNQMGASFAVPVLIWIAVTFKQSDALRLS